MYRYLRNILFFVVILLVFVLSNSKAFAQTEAQQKAMWIYQNFAEQVNWKNEQNIKKFKITVYGNDYDIYSQLLNYSRTKKIKGKPFTVYYVKKITNIGTPDILFVSNTSNDDIKLIFDKTPLNTLLITDQCLKKEYFMINFLPFNSSKKRFELNTKNANDAGITISKDLLKYGGSEVQLRGLYSATEKELRKEREKLERKKKELDKQKQELLKLRKEIREEKLATDEQHTINKRQKNEIKTQKEELELQEVRLKDIQDNLLIQKEKLNFSQKVLNSQKSKIAIQKKKVEKLNTETKEKIALLKKAEAEILTKNEAIGEQDVTIGDLRTIIFGFIILIIIVLILTFYSLRSSRLRKKANDELRYKNIAIYKQKEEIENQQKQTDLLNIELEKLSIVAAKTDNAVTIMDENGNFEWVNVGFTQMYGYTLQLLINELDENIIKASANKNIANIIDKCKTEKKSQIYEYETKKRNGQKIWIQTTLTPILDSENNVKKLITIETDISRSRRAEQEIRKQHEKILEQSNMLEASNKELEKLSLVASGTDNAITIMDAAGNYQWVNDGFSRLFEYSYTQLISEYSRNIISNDVNENTKQIIKKSIEKKVPVNYELLVPTRTGKKIWVQTTLTPVVDNDGDIKSLISISSNISELKRAEQAIRQQSEELLAQKEELIFQNDMIEQQNQNITASISYAKTIQNAILPPENELNSSFENIVIFKPKDIVSGDFYWYSKLPARDGFTEKQYFAVIDCTGHGVPGAFMSMIGSRLLNEIVNEKKILKPSAILDHLNEGIKNTLRQENSDNNDGMDVCLTVIEKLENGNNKMMYAGAKRPLYIYSKQENKLKYIKGTRKSIGGMQAKRNTEVFEDNNVILQKNDVLYLSTDGIIDQSSKERIRFGSLRLIQLLKNIGGLPLSEQKNAILNSLNEYQGVEDQRDDITFMAIKI